MTLGEDKELSRILGFFRSLQIFDMFPEHKKCDIPNKSSKEGVCSFCLLRSLMLKSRKGQGRQLIKPVEILCDQPSDFATLSTIQNIIAIIDKMKTSLPAIGAKIATQWQCLECMDNIKLTEDYCIGLERKETSRCIDHLIASKSKELIQTHSCSTRLKEEDFKINSNVKVCIFKSLD